MPRYLLALTLLLCNTITSANNLALVKAARQQIGVTRHYDSRYQILPYPNGDVPLDRGVCTDVIIRAYRQLHFDLQKAVHEDMTAHWDRYPHLWQLKAPDKNIDHRRVPNLARYFQRFGQTLTASTDGNDYRAGDIVTWRLPSGVPHIGLVSDRSIGMTPLVIHNIGNGTEEDNVLFAYQITGHFRFTAP